jgi:hypothetical protein
LHDLGTLHLLAVPIWQVAATLQLLATLHWFAILQVRATFFLKQPEQPEQPEQPPQLQPACVECMCICIAIITPSVNKPAEVLVTQLSFHSWYPECDHRGATALFSCVMMCPTAQNGSKPVQDVRPKLVQ